MLDNHEAFERARREISYAYESVGFFREHMDQARCRPSDLRVPADLQKVPATQKRHYRSNFPHGVLAKGHSLDEPFLTRMQSSGTEGERLISVNYLFNLAERMATCLGINERFRFLLEAREIRTCRYAAPNCSDVECANPNSTMQDRILPDQTLVLPVYHDLLTTPPAMMQRAASEIGAYQPNLLYVDPVHMSWLIRFLQESGVSSFSIERPFGVILSYTLATRLHRKRIQEFLGPEVPVASVLAMSEFGYLGMECVHGTMHLNGEDFYLELLCDGRPAQAGELAELFVTTLGDELSPKIRYQTGDLYRLASQPCACGSRHPAVIPEGRKKNMLTSARGELVSARTVDELVGARPWIDLYQLTQMDGPRYLFRFIGNRSQGREEEAQLRQSLAGLFQSDRVQLGQTEYLPSERGGKFMFCQKKLRDNDSTDRHE